MADVDRKILVEVDDKEQGVHFGFGRTERLSRYCHFVNRNAVIPAVIAWSRPK